MKKKEFWITNISNRNVSIADLNLTIKSLSSINLLDQKHYYYNWEQIEQSSTIGSIFNKRDKLFIRKNSPIINNNIIPFSKEEYMPTRERSILNIKEEVYEELNITDEQFAEENADSAELDRQPIIVKV